MSVFFVVLISLIEIEGQVNYYVSVNGNDLPTNGLTTLNAFKTIPYAISFLQAGDTLNIMAGVYKNPTFGNYNFFKPQTDCAIYLNNVMGTASEYIVIRRHKEDPVVLKGDGLAIVHIKNCKYIKLENFEIYGEVENIPLDTAWQYQFLYKESNGQLKYRMPPLSPPSVVAAAVLPVLTNIERPTYFNTMGIIVSNCEYVEIYRNLAHHCPGEGMRSANSDFIKFIENEIHNCSRRSATGVHGLSIYTMQSKGTEDTTTIQMVRNRVHHNYNEVYSWSSTKEFINPHFDEGKGITVQRCTADYGWTVGRILIANNLCYRNGFSGVHVNDGDHIDILNNTVYKNHLTHELNGDGSQIGISAQGSTDIKIANNIAVVDPAYFTTANTLNILSPTTPFEISNNIILGSLNGAAANLATSTIVQDPKFVNENEFIFRLKTGSPAINIPNIKAPPTDFYNKTRILPELGAVEFLSGCNPLVTVNTNAGAGSLHQILDCSLEGDTIKFSPALGVINLTTPLYINKYITFGGSDPVNLAMIQQKLQAPSPAQIIVKPAEILSIYNMHFKGLNNAQLLPNIHVYGQLKVSQMNMITKN